MNGILQGTHTPRLFVIVLALLWISGSHKTIHVSAEVYYVTPTSSTPCPGDSVNCHTLSEYANKQITFFAANTTLILLPGNHSLGSQLSITGLSYLALMTIYSERSVQSVVSIECNQSGRITFKYIAEIFISNVSFLDCVKGSARAITTNYSSVTLLNCAFYSNTTPLQAAPENEHGGIMYHENSNVSIYNSTFTIAASMYGGVMAHLNCNVTIFNSMFLNNAASVQGGVMYHENSNVEIYNSTFANNKVIGSVHKELYGGVMAHWKCNVSIYDSTFMSNVHGGVMYHRESNVSIHNSRFTGNTAKIGGVMHHYLRCNVTIHNSTFINNTASEYGGVMFHSEKSYVAIHNCSFKNNTANKYGGVMHHLKSNVSICNSVFTNNTAEEYFGGVMYHYLSNITTYNSVFNGNIALRQGGVMYHWSSDVTIQNSSFTHNKQSVMFHMKSNVTVHNSMFMENSAMLQGGVMDHWNSNVSIHNSTFIKNYGANVSGGALYHMNSTVTCYDCWFINNTARKGGAMLIQVSNITLQNNVFVNNSAQKYGATLFIDSCNFTSNGRLEVKNNTAGLLGTFYATESSLILNGVTTFKDNFESFYVSSCNVTFLGETNLISTQSLTGGALSAFQSEVAFFGMANMVSNKAVNMSGGAISLTESKLYTYGTIDISNNSAMNGGGIYAYQSELNFEGRTIIEKNRAEKRGGGIYAISSTVKILPGTHELIANTGNKGGGMCLELNAKIYILIKLIKTISTTTDGIVPQNKLIDHKKDTMLSFSGNLARKHGGAIFMSDDTNSATCAPADTSSMVESECFLQALASYKDVFEVMDYKSSMLYVHFDNNSADKGDTLYGGLVDRCSLNPFSEFLYVSNSSEVAEYIKTVTNIEEQDFKLVISSDPVRVCFCHSNQPDCSYSPSTVHVWKGETFKVSVVAVDQVNNTISNTSIHSSPSPQAGLGEGQSIQTTGDGCTELEYTVTSPHDSENITLYAEGPCKDSGISASIFYVEFISCPIGFEDGESKCDCDPKLSGLISNCSIDTQSVLRNGSHSWISYANTSQGNGTNYLTYQYCPFDYCHPSIQPVWINLNIPNGADAQCAFNRSGILCGSCEDGLSLSFGSSHCMPCSNEWLALLIVFAMAGVALVTFIHVLNLTVVVGTINPLIFYANIVFSNRTIFMPFQKQNLWSRIPTVFIAWLNLDLGIQTCFYNGMDGYVKTWLQLTFPAYIILLVAMVIIASEYSEKLTKIISHRRNPVSTLATLILLSYTKILRTIIAALAFVRLKQPDGSSKTQWLVDANMGYYDWNHVLLIVVAVAIIIVGLVFTSLVLTSLVLFWQCLQKCPNKRYLRLFTHGKLYSFMDVYLAPYNLNHRYYFGTLLLVRVILHIVSALTSHLDPSYTLLTTISISASLLLLGYFVKVFKHWSHQVLEALFLINLLIFAAGTSCVKNAGGNQDILAAISITVSFGAFIVILIHPIMIMFLRLKNRFRRDSYHETQFEQDTLQLTDDDDIEAGVSYSEVDCPVINETDQDDTFTNDQSLNRAEDVEEKSMPPHTLTKHTDSGVDTDLASSQSGTDTTIQTIDTNERNTFELQTFAISTEDNHNDFRLEEESEYSNDEMTPLLLQD